MLLTGAQADKDIYEQAMVDYYKHLDTVKTVLRQEAPEFLPQITGYGAAVADYATQDMSEEVRLALVPATLDQARDILLSGRIQGRLTKIKETGDRLRDDISN